MHKLNERQKDTLQAIIIYAAANVDDINEAYTLEDKHKYGEDFTFGEVMFLDSLLVKDSET